MRRSTLWVCALVAISTFGCDRIKQEIEKRRHPTTTPPQHPRPTPAVPAPVAPATPAPTPPATRSGTPRLGGQGPAAPGRDEAYQSPDTGTLAPGMAEREVYALWGAPVAVRRSGEYTYLFFRNGCEYSCGTPDVVTLQNGHVVDAIVRWPGHIYSGQSSSPKSTKPHARPGGDTLRVPAPGTE